MKKIKSLFLFITLLAGLIFLSACGSDVAKVADSDKEGNKEGNNEQITLKFLRPGPAEVVNPIFNPLLEQFMKENPNIKVESMNMGFQDTAAKYPVMASSGTLPDVMYATMDRGFDLALNDKLIPLDDYLTNSNLKEEIPESLWNGITFKDNHYWIPSGVGSIVLWYNKDLFKKAGLDPNNPPQTLDELITVAQTITEKTGVPGLGLPGAVNVDHLSTMFQSVYSSMSGNPLWDSSKESLTISLEENKAHAIKALQYLHDLVNKHKVTQSNVVEFSRNDLRPLMRDGKVGMVLDGIWIKGVIKDQIANGSIAPTTFPAGEGGSHSLVGVDGWSIAANSKHQDAAWKLIQFLMKTENQAKHGISYGLNPVLKSEYELPEFKTDFWKPIIKSEETGYSRIAHKNIASLETTISEGVQAAITGASTPEEALEYILKETEPFLKK